MSENETRAQALVCRSYTHARRHPKVIGKIAGWTLPWPITPLQLFVAVGGFLTLLQTRGLWAHLGGLVDLLILVALPSTAAVLLRHLRVEGRSPARFLCGYASVLSAPRHGRRHGRPVRPPRPQRVHGTVFCLPTGPTRVAPAPPARTAPRAAGPTAAARTPAPRAAGTPSARHLPATPLAPAAAPPASRAAASPAPVDTAAAAHARPRRQQPDRAQEPLLMVRVSLAELVERARAETGGGVPTTTADAPRAPVSRCPAPRTAPRTAPTSPARQP